MIERYTIEEAKMKVVEEWDALAERYPDWSVNFKLNYLAMYILPRLFSSVLGIDDWTPENKATHGEDARRIRDLLCEELELKRPI